MLVVLGIILLVAGAIVTYGIDAAVEGVDLQAIGYIIMAGGGIALLAGAIQAAGWFARTNKHMTSERHVSPDGRHVVEESHTT